MKIRKYVPAGKMFVLIDTKTGLGFNMWNDFKGIETRETGIKDLNDLSIFIGDIISDGNNIYVVEESVESLKTCIRNIDNKSDVATIPRKNGLFTVIGNIFELHLLSDNIRKRIES